MRNTMTRSASLSIGRLFTALILTGCMGTSLVGCGAKDDYPERMAEEHKADTPVASPAAAVETQAEIESATVTYANLDGEEVTGFLAKPAGIENAPGVIVIHEWWGLNENIESMARQLAEAGYVALAVDLYGGEVAADRDKARELMTASMDRGEVLKRNLKEAYAFLKGQGATKVASIGWCFGGGWSLQTALLLPGELDGAIIYYGRVVTDRDQLATLTTPILGHFGSEDGGIPVAGVREFEKALTELGKDGRIHIYEGADHAFANPSGTRYAAEAATLAWQRTLDFLTETLGS